MPARLNPAVSFAWCERALEAWTEDGGYTLGFVDKTTKQWTWLVESCRLAEIRIPNNMSSDDEAPYPGGPRDAHEVPQEKEPEDDQEMDMPAAQPEAGVVRAADTDTRRQLLQDRQGPQGQRQRTSHTRASRRAGRAGGAARRPTHLLKGLAPSPSLPDSAHSVVSLHGA